MELKRTPLYEAHLRCGGKMVEFGGFEMPVQYKTGVIREHMAVRTACGLFDVSHMGEVIMQGPDTVSNLNRLLTNDYTVMKDGQARYSPMCNEQGGTVDDLIVYRITGDRYFVVVNASNREKDVNWIKAHVSGETTVEDVSDSFGQIAIQGPLAERILLKLTAAENIPKGNYTALWDRSVGGVNCIVSRTGYTGSDGFELYTPAEDTEKLWDLLLEAGKEEELIPCGLGARDTLRLEAGMPLYGHELSDTISPLTAGLGYFVKMDKEDFVGKDAIAAQKAGGVARKLVGIELSDNAIPRAGYPVELPDGTPVGVVTTGYHSISLDKSVCFALVESACSALGTELCVRIRKKVFGGKVVKKRFYQTNYKK